MHSIMGKYNRRPKLRSVTRTRAKKSVRRNRSENVAPEAYTAGAEEPRKGSMKKVLIPLLILLLLLLCGIAFAMAGKGTGEAAVQEASTEEAGNNSVAETVPPTGI